jgi:hypothetical protein
VRGVRARVIAFRELAFVIITRARKKITTDYTDNTDRKKKKEGAERRGD